jgi:DNA polymerase-3 subunit delta'
VIKEFLTSRLDYQRLSSSWLINATSLGPACLEVENFVKEMLLDDNINLKNHPDFKKISRLEADQSQQKNILVGQIAELGAFLNKTSGISGYKVGIIMEADLMNTNAANACLKILEDTPKHSYLFLITSKPGNILPTIRSRCAKINDVSKLLPLESYLQSVTLLNSTSTNLDNQLAFINQFSEKNRVLWQQFANNILLLVAKIIKNSFSINQSITQEEEEIIDQIKFMSTTDLIELYDKIVALINQVTMLDLELKSATLLLFSYFNIELQTDK